jgi:hypothetical protein
MPDNYGNYRPTEMHFIEFNNVYRMRLCVALYVLELTGSGRLRGIKYIPQCDLSVTSSRHLPVGCVCVRVLFNEM